MSFENPTVLRDAVASHAELESLVERVVELTIAQINGTAVKPFLTAVNAHT